MKNKLLIFSALICLILCIGAVNAENITEADDTLATDNSDVLTVSNAKSFTDLNDDYKNSSDTLNIENDYKFDSQKDVKFNRGIEINLNYTKNYTINGNNHIIDADNKSSIFRFINTNVTINNLKIFNANLSAIMLQNSILTTNNVTFENNYDSIGGAAIYAYESNYYSNNDKFINNYAKMGSAINGELSIIQIDDSIFKSDKPSAWSLIYGENCNMNIINCNFENLNSTYATAIYSKGGKLNVTKSRFSKLYANATAGAIGIKKTSEVNIKECNFTDIRAERNGGAIFTDFNANGDANGNYIIISDCIFENCSSEFGGAYLQLGGFLKIIDSKFNNNFADSSGGAVYCSDTTLSIGNTVFENTWTETYEGGALFIDNSHAQITLCDFIDNDSPVSGDAIYLYDTLYSIKNCYFINSTETIISFFDKEGSALENNQLNKGEVTLNQTDYTYFVEHYGLPIILNPKTITGNATDSVFDLRAQNLTGKVKNQGSMGACWAFASTEALESAIYMATGISVDLSENNLQNTALKYSKYGTNILPEGGFTDCAEGLFLSWFSAFTSEYDPYDELGKIGLMSIYENSYHVYKVINIPARENSLDNSKLKEALVKYGEICIPISGSATNNLKQYYNETTHAQYYNGKPQSDHYVTLVGWNDSYSKDNFIIKPKGDGAWICKNSWGTNWGEEGYFYVSYYDTSIATDESSAYAITNDNYTRLYQYDLGGRYGVDNKSTDYFNTYEAVDDELIEAVGTFFEKEGQNYKITVYVDENPVYTQSGTSTIGGYETIKLDKTVAVNAGQKFTVEFEGIHAPITYNARHHAMKDTSFVITNEGRYDLVNNNLAACIKVYTAKNTNPSRANAQYYSKTNKNVTIYSSAECKNISLVKNGEIIDSAVVSNGTAFFNLSLGPGHYSIYTPQNGTYLVEAFDILHTILFTDNVTITYNVDLTCKCVLVDSYGIGLPAGQNISVKLDNNKPILIAIKDNLGTLEVVTDSLSMGKHKIKFVNPVTGEVRTMNIKVVSKFVGNKNINMYYADGTAFKSRILDLYANPVGKNNVVTIKLNKVTYKVKTNSNGYITFKIPNTVKAGTYTLTASFQGQTIKNTVKVKNVVTLAKVTVKKSAKKIVLKATLKKGTVPLKYKKVTFKFNGKTYTKKTNKYGVAKVPIYKSTLSKLKVGKKITYQVTYIKTTVKKTVKVNK